MENGYDALKLLETETPDETTVNTDGSEMELLPDFVDLDSHPIEYDSDDDEDLDFEMAFDPSPEEKFFISSEK